MSPVRRGLVALGVVLLLLIPWILVTDSLAPPTPSIPVPAFAEPGPFNGAFEPRIDTAISAARRTLADWGRLDAAIFRVPDGQPMAPIVAHYDRELDGWARAPDAAHPDARRPLVGWARNEDRFAALLVPGHAEDPWTFLVLLTPTAD